MTDPGVTTVNTHSRTRELATAALVAAFAAAGAFITIPIGAVPVTLQTFAVFLAALVLTPGWAAASISVYLLLGIAGLPVFSGGQAGLGVLAGPTGGYLIGFVVGAALGSAVRIAIARTGKTRLADIAGVTVTLLAVYAIGTIQLAAVAGLTPMQAITAGVVPFIGFDVLKAVAAVFVAQALRRAGIR